jgi:sugar lactone lactonase YvrE
MKTCRNPGWLPLAFLGIMILSSCEMSDDTSNQMGGSIQGKSLSLSGATSTLAGTAGSSGATDGTGTAARFYNPYGITTDGTNLYVADFGNNTIRKVVISSGAVTTLAGTAGSSGYADGTGTAAKFYFPCGITTDGAKLLVADPGNNTVRTIK